MSLDFLSCITSFVAVAEYKGFSPAARYLRISTPTLTNQLKRLEDLLGKKLLHRTTRYVALTEVGEIYLKRAQKILEEIQAAEHEIQHLEKEPHGLLTIGVPHSFHAPFVIKHLQEFLHQYPKMQLKIIDNNSPDNLLTGLCDLVITEMDVKNKQFIKEHLFSLYRNIYAAPSYLKKHGVPKDIADLKDHNCLVVTNISPSNEWILGNNKKIIVNGNYSSSSGSNVFYAGLAGLGLIWCADIAIKEEINRRKLVEVQLEDAHPVEIKIYLYHRPVNAANNIKLMANHLKKMTVAVISVR